MDASLLPWFTPQKRRSGVLALLDSPTITSLSDATASRAIDSAVESLAPAIPAPPIFVRFLLLIEDKRFGQHWGVDLPGIARAAIRDLQTMRWTEGGSTLTQQLVRVRASAKSDESRRSLIRKGAEALTALLEESRSTKAEILGEYLELAYWGRSYYGWRTAASGYFATSPEQLSSAQCFFLAERLAAPNKVRPLRVVNLLRRPMIAQRFDLASVEELVASYEAHFGSGEIIWRELAKSHKK